MDSVLPIGKKHGCFTIIGGFEVYQEEFAKKKIADLEQKKQRFINGEIITGNTFDSVDVYDRFIQDWKSCKKYQCQCECGKVKYLGEIYFSGKKYRDCGDNCAVKQERERKRIASYPRVKDESYDINYLYTTHESLEVLECIDENYEGKPIIFHRGRRGRKVANVKYISYIDVVAICVVMNMNLNHQILR
ncbi:hypothetical protein BG07_5653 (plasmid) [Bacillus pseudomycoides]|uniref:hypothetical protein n=1 Tax=Bacillus TaxID=1386 RepID=UPI000360B80C|nr:MULTISPECIES: hypothetical protein [Bacillus]AIK35622.1 hypothetical protein DJ92_5615 [Bacillus pseudomycoides]AJI14609.1 hypothetical protein BG07_5653 [Bacillus pseudomycoides]MEB3057295.1 hypothetical protein [Bacillus pseudomycoides]